MDQLVFEANEDLNLFLYHNVKESQVTIKQKKSDLELFKHER